MTTHPFRKMAEKRNNLVTLTKTINGLFRRVFWQHQDYITCCNKILKQYHSCISLLNAFTKAYVERSYFIMADKNNQFKENSNHGEHRNGRKSPFKNSNSHGGNEPNEYVDKKKR